MKYFCYAKMDVERTKKLAEDCIKEIEETRKRKDEATEKQYIDEWNTPTWFDKLFRTKPRQHTKEDVAKYLKGDWFYPSKYAWGTLDECMAIISACNNSSDGFVLISAEMLKKIQ
jgi:hypothetical protein